MIYVSAPSAAFLFDDKTAGPSGCPEDNPAVTMSICNQIKPHEFSLKQNSEKQSEILTSVSTDCRYSRRSAVMPRCSSHNVRHHPRCHMVGHSVAAAADNITDSEPNRWRPRVDFIAFFRGWRKDCKRLAGGGC